MRPNATERPIRKGDAHLRVGDSNQRPCPSEKYKAHGLDTIMLSSQEAFVYSPASGSSGILSTSEIALLEACNTFARIDDHAHGLANTFNVGPSQFDDLLRRLSELERRGFLVSESQLVDRIIRNRPLNEQNHHISWIAIPTRNRVECLARALTSYLDHTVRHGRKVLFVVSDDSEDAETREANRAILRRLKKEWSADIFYAGKEEKILFLQELTRHCSVSGDLIEFALFNKGHSVSPGACSNALLLQTVGDMLLSVDDDSLCRLAAIPNSTGGLKLSSAVDPTDYWFFHDADATLSFADFVDVDLLAVHERFLGRELSDCVVEAREAGSLQLDEMSARFREVAECLGGRVGLTSAGVVGDSGMDLPRGLLLLGEASRARLTESESKYRSNLRSRQMLRGVRCSTIGDQLFCAGGNLGLDNRSLLPPFMPVLRGQDDIFGYTLKTCFPSHYLCCLPYALCHAPLEPRECDLDRFWRDPAVALFDQMFSLLIVSLKSLPLRLTETDRMLALGQYLTELGSIPHQEFRDIVKRLVCQRRAYMLHLVANLSTNEQLAPYHRNDINRLSAALRDALASSNYVVPAELEEEYGPEDGSTAFQRLTRRYGQLLTAWPCVVQAAKKLRAAGTFLAHPV